MLKKGDKKRSIKGKFFRGVVLPPLIPFVVIGLVGIYIFNISMYNKATSELSRSASTTASKIDREFEVRQDFLKKIGEETIGLDKRQKLEANIATVANSNTEAKPPSLANIQSISVPQRLLSTYANFFPETRAVEIYANNGDVIANWGDYKSLKQIAANKQRQSKILYSTKDKRIYMIEKFSGGSVVASFDALHSKFLKPSWQTAPRPQDSTIVYVLDPQRVVAFPKIDQNEKIAIIAGPKNTNILSKNNKKFLGAASPIGDSGWSVFAGSDPNQVMAPVKNAQLGAIAMLIATLIASILVGIRYIGVTTRTVKALAIGAKEFLNHNLDYRLNISTNDEFQTLGEGMNSMAAAISANEKMLAEKNREFISIASHELKTPLTAISGNLSMVLEDDVKWADDETKHQVNQAYKATYILKNLVSDLLDVARLEEGKSRFDIRAIEVNSIAREVIEQQSLASAKQNIALNIVTGESLVYALADYGKLKIILSNFVSNAIKYNRVSGAVYIGAQVQNGMVLVMVKDTGLGIPDDQRDKIFQKFFRVRNPDRSNVDGTGLGMYLTKQYIEVMGGQVWFESIYGQGTSFFFTLPMSHPQI